jgi:hypothetical protein
MKMSIVDYAEANASPPSHGTKPIRKWPVLLLFLLLSITFGIVGCEEEHYGAYPGYGPYYGGNGPYGRGYAANGPYGRGYAANGPYGPGYGGYPGNAYPGSVTVEIGDRPYYNRGAGYYVGRSYYVWRPGHWVRRNGQRVWIHGHYVVRG